MKTKVVYFHVNNLTQCLFEFSTLEWCCMIKNLLDYKRMSQ